MANRALFPGNQAPVAQLGTSYAGMSRLVLAAGVNTVQATAPVACRIVDAFLNPHGVGGGGSTIQVQRTTGGVTNSVTTFSTAGSVDGTLIRATTIDRTHWAMNAGDTYAVVGSAGSPAADVILTIVSN